MKSSSLNMDRIGQLNLELHALEYTNVFPMHL